MGCLCSIVFLFSVLLIGCSCQLCDQLPNDTWSDFVFSIETSFGFPILCPFHISGSGCPTNTDGYMVENSDLYILCEKGPQQQGCTIDCPGSHFQVLSGASLTLDGIILRGATESSIQLLNGGTLITFHTQFQK